MKKITFILLFALILTLLGLIIEMRYPYTTGNECASVLALDNWCYSATYANGYPLSVFIQDAPMKVSDLEPRYENLLINFLFYIGIAHLLISGGIYLKRKFTSHNS